MKIDWKAVAQSPGYKSLKKAYIRDVHKAGQTRAKGHRPMRDKEEFLKLFQWVIGRAQHYAIRQSRTVEDVLNEWESERNYRWLNYYQECNQPKLPSGKPRNVRHMKPDTYHRQQRWHRPGTKAWFHDLRNKRTRDAQFTRKYHRGKKPRCSKEHKDRMARIRSYRKQNL